MLYLYVTHTIRVASQLASRYIRAHSCLSGEVMSRNSNQKVNALPDDMDGPSVMFEELDGLLGYRLRRAQGAMHQSPRR